ncbi:DUF2306 domain-containing protein [Aporhodopirellula aestuarii]|uniref:DUF2306 domain-containing protein n=1 Tax=Aporhodopirellula aestuarii TaxID=2950107 RepID=A0ABT0UC77_9BACT|nr:DUF2306 domain-containing protein [Aporhodopirellula aestuarii]MCM2374520.1 DUF2306 domain-containing protein [Aporhodopirellula aestuarii]
MAQTINRDERDDGKFRRRELLARILFWAVVLVLVKVFLSIVIEYRRYFPADFESNFLSGRRHSFTGGYRQAFYVHILSSPIALVLATFLVVSGGKKRWQVMHRFAGRIQFILVLLVVVPSGMVMAKDAYAGPISAAGFISLNVATAACLVMAVWRARNRKFVAHRRWATRSFVLLASPLLLRLIAGAAIVTGWESERSYQLNSWISWLIPLMIYEICFAYPKPRQFSSGTSAVIQVENGGSR